jgi:hypothetical protein
MSSFGRKLKRFGGAKAPSRNEMERKVDEALMLAFGKQFIEEDGMGFDEQDRVLFIGDVRDPIGAVWAEGAKRSDHPELPFAAFWMKRLPETTELVNQLGLDLTAHGPMVIENPPPKGTIYTVLRWKGGGGTVGAVNYSKVPSLSELGVNSKSYNENLS